MPEQVKITLFSFDELSEESQQNVIEGFRDEYEPYYEAVYEDFVERMKEDFGAEIDLREITWTGFFSAGDGASFTCGFDSDVLLPKLKEELNKDQIAFLDSHDIAFYFSSVRTSYRYCHENTVEGKIDYDADLNQEEEKILEEIHDIFESKLTEIIREESRSLYKQLEDFHDSEMEDERMIEEIKECYPDCCFREDGTVFKQ